ncbi:MAG: Cof-type HAD-IIB family hydrolase [Sediminicola sp.]|tara:strand:+ start:13488 stop:14291 length:804 start_codon:yes stop_codon:yes gene_type:complete
MDFKVLCSDLDGTLLTTKSNVSTFTISEINRIKEHIRIILVSARMPKAMTYLQRNLGITDHPLVCYNGALVLEGQSIIKSVTLPLEKVQNVFDLAQPLGIDLGLYHHNEWYVPHNTERVRKEIHYTQATPIFRDTKATLEDWKQRGIGPHKIMLMGDKNTSDIITPQLLEIFMEHMHVYRSNDTLIEVAPKSVSKLSGIQLLLKKDETLEDVIAFGDNYNDMDMLQNVGCGVAVGNAREAVKQIARHTTLNNTEDGVAHFIKRYVLI